MLGFTFQVSSFVYPIQYLLIPALGYYGKPIILNIDIDFINVRGPRTFK